MSSINQPPACGYRFTWHGDLLPNAVIPVRPVRLAQVETGRAVRAMLGCLALLAAMAPRLALAGELRAGVAKVDITPEKPVTLAGYEVRSSSFAPGADERLIEETLRLLRAL